MTFAVAASAYDRFMGRYSEPLAPAFADFAGVRKGGRVLDVGCGPGALTAVLIERVGADAVSAVDPSESFVASLQERRPEVDVRLGSTERLPYEDGTFEATVAQLVVHFLSDPVAGIREMARVTRRGGVVAACVWDHAGGTGPLAAFWEAVHELDGDVEDEARLPGAREGHLGELFRGAGLHDVEEGSVSARVEHPSFDDWWEPYTLGVGPAGAYVAGLPPERRAELRERCRALLPEPPFALEAKAWTARARAV